MKRKKNCIKRNVVDFEVDMRLGVKEKE